MIDLKPYTIPELLSLIQDANTEIQSRQVVVKEDTFNISHFIEWMEQRLNLCLTNGSRTQEVVYYRNSLYNYLYNNERFLRSTKHTNSMHWFSLSDIGKHFNRRDHSTVLNGINTYNNLIGRDERFTNIYNIVQGLIFIYNEIEKEKVELIKDHSNVTIIFGGTIPTTYPVK